MTLIGQGPAPAPTTRADSGSEVVGKLLTKDQMPECSYRFQLTGVDGDAGRVLSSWRNGDNGLPSRDPETPIFEAYDDERIVFRLIQGAQEVQHVFNVAGMAGPRNLDQRAPQGMRDLAVSVQPARKLCFDRMRKGFLRGYDNWLNGQQPPNPSYEAALANCDNVEGYSFAQEIGISEHFELRTRFRSGVSTTESVAPPVSPQEPQINWSLNGPQTGHRLMSDYLYNFGTLDAFWNGAWGLVGSIPMPRPSIRSQKTSGAVEYAPTLSVGPASQDQ